MRILLARSEVEWNEYAARCVAEVVRTEASPVLGLATGETPIGAYARLVAMANEGELDFSAVRTFNLDEYLDLAPDHPATFLSYMRRHLFDRVNIRPERTHIPVANPDDASREAAQYSDLLRQHGPCHLQVLGIGRNGHIGFNEPGTPFDSTTHVVQLAESTRQANAPAFGGDPDQVPQRAITMGIAEIMSAQRILLLVRGRSKAAILSESLEGPVSESVPASILQTHSDLIVVVDPEGAAELSPELLARSR